MSPAQLKGIRQRFATEIHTRGQDLWAVSTHDPRFLEPYSSQHLLAASLIMHLEPSFPQSSNAASDAADGECCRPWVENGVPSVIDSFESKLSHIQSCPANP